MALTDRQFKRPPQQQQPTTALDEGEAEAEPEYPSPATDMVGAFAWKPPMEEALEHSSLPSTDGRLLDGRRITRWVRLQNNLNDLPDDLPDSLNLIPTITNGRRRLHLLSEGNDLAPMEEALEHSSLLITRFVPAKNGRRRLYMLSKGNDLLSKEDDFGASLDARDDEEAVVEAGPEETEPEVPSTVASLLAQVADDVMTAVVGAFAPTPSAEVGK